MHVYVLWQKQKSLLLERNRMREKESPMKSMWLKPIKRNNRFINNTIEIECSRPNDNGLWDVSIHKNNMHEK